MRKHTEGEKKKERDKNRMLKKNGGSNDDKREGDREKSPERARKNR